MFVCSKTQSRQAATLIDFVPHPEGDEEGCVFEVFNAVGEWIAVVAVPLSSVEGLRSDAILTIHPFAKAG